MSISTGSISAQIHSNEDIRARVKAALVSYIIAKNYTQVTEQDQAYLAARWFRQGGIDNDMWMFATQGAWITAWQNASSRPEGSPPIGQDEGVITTTMINVALKAVSTLRVLP